MPLRRSAKRRDFAVQNRILGEPQFAYIRPTEGECSSIPCDEETHRHCGAAEASCAFERSSALRSSLIA